MRVAQDDGNGDAPVALSPTPEPGPTETPGDTVTNTPPRESDSLSTEATGEKGYAAYANGGSLRARRIGQWTRTGVGESPPASSSGMPMPGPNSGRSSV